MTSRRVQPPPEALGCATGIPPARPGGWSRQAAPPPLPSDIVADLRRLAAEDWAADDELIRDLDFASHDGEGRRKP